MHMLYIMKLALHVDSLVPILKFIVDVVLHVGQVPMLVYIKYILFFYFLVFTKKLAMLLIRNQSS